MDSLISEEELQVYFGFCPFEAKPIEDSSTLGHPFFAIKDNIDLKMSQPAPAAKQFTYTQSNRPRLLNLID